MGKFVHEEVEGKVCIQRFACKCSLEIILVLHENRTVKVRKGIRSSRIDSFSIISKRKQVGAR